MIIFQNVGDKIKEYDCQKDGRAYNCAYRKVLDARPLVDEAGNVSEISLQAIENGLRAFRMGRQMDEKFRERLKKKIEKSEIKPVLKKLRNIQIDSPRLNEYRPDIKKLYEMLSESGEDGLSSRRDGFDVGATKIMNFLFPDLFIMIDKNVAKALNRSGSYYFEKYWDIMMIFRKESQEWKELHGSTDSLLELDTKPTTLTRIFDKCAFVMGKKKRRGLKGISRE